MLRKVISFLLCATMVMSFGGGVLASGISSEKYEEDMVSTNTDNTKNIIDINLIELLKKEGIEYNIEKGKIKLVDSSTSNIDKVNEIIKSSENQSSLRASTYPSQWYHLKNDDIKTSKKFIKATNTAFYTAMTGWVTGQCSTPQQVATAAVLAFGGYYFNNTDVENIYFFKSHHYRILGPHWFDGNGTAYGNYELKRNVRTTKSTSGAGGQLTTKTQKTTSIWSLW